MTGSSDHRDVKPRLDVRSARRLLWLTIAIVGVAACEPGGQPGGTTTTSLEAPGGTQQVWCAGQGRGVVLINGIGDQTSSRQWLDVQVQLSQHARVCRYDRPGTGDSPPPTQSNRGPEELELELDAVVNHTTDGEVILVAHSFGGYLARLYTERQPERVRGIVFVDALDPSVGLVRGTGVDDLGEVAMADEQLDLHALETATAAVTEFPPDIEVGVLIRERAVTPAWMEGQQQLAALSPRSHVEVITDTSHQIPTDAPQAIADTVRRLLEQRRPVDAGSARRTTSARSGTSLRVSGVGIRAWVGHPVRRLAGRDSSACNSAASRLATVCVSTDAPAIARTA